MREEVSQEISFVTIADEGFKEPLLQSLQQNQTLYPASTTYVYDWGLSPETRTKIKTSFPQATLIDWQLQYVSVDVEYGWRFSFIKSLTLFRDGLKQLLGIAKENSALKSLIKAHDFEIKIFNKFLCLEHFAHQYERPFLFLDADAFLVQRIDEVLADNSADVFFTIRRPSELSYAFNHCSVLNVGVMFFLGSQDKRLALFKLWRNELEKTRERFCEQTSLTRLLADEEPDLYAMLGSSFALNDVRIKLLPCEVYNFNWIEEIERTDDTIKVLHFKSGRYTTDLFAKMTAK